MAVQPHLRKCFDAMARLEFAVAVQQQPTETSTPDLGKYRLQSCHVCAFICINFAQKVFGIVGLFSKFSYEIRHNLVELFGAKLV